MSREHLLGTNVFLFWIVPTNHYQSLLIVFSMVILTSLISYPAIRNYSILRYKLALLTVTYACLKSMYTWYINQGYTYSIKRLFSIHIQSIKRVQRLAECEDLVSCGASVSKACLNSPNLFSTSDFSLLVIAFVKILYITSGNTSIISTGTL